MRDDETDFACPSRAVAVLARWFEAQSHNLRVALAGAGLPPEVVDAQVAAMLADVDTVAAETLAGLWTGRAAVWSALAHGRVPGRDPDDRALAASVGMVLRGELSVAAAWGTREGCVEWTAADGTRWQLWRHTPDGHATVWRGPEGAETAVAAARVVAGDVVYELPDAVPPEVQRRFAEGLGFDRGTETVH